MPSSTQSNVTYSNEIFKQYLMQLSTGIVWKNTTRAAENESDDTLDLYLAELFIVANRGLLNFDVVKSFPRSVLRSAGIPDAYIEMCASDKTKIPTNMRQYAVDEYARALTSKDPVTGHYAYLNTETGLYETIYNETNNYYRMLMGLPDVDDTDYIYNTDSRWDTTTPIHNLPLVSRIEMETEGVLDTLLEANPTKEYIMYLGRKNVDFFTSRIAERFEILYRADCVSDVLNSDFDDAYNHNRYLVNTVYYSSAFKKSNELYENFLAMCILFMTLQYMQHKYLQVDITRDFYDTESLKLVYDSYQVPFYTEIPLEYHRKIVKNINKLISYKGSSQVFFDLFDIFDLGSMDIYSYFLIKTHRFDEEGNPTFIIQKDEDGNDMYDDEGHPILDPSNYTLKFSKVKIYDDPALAVSDDSNDVEYNLITDPDPYWIEDADLQAKLADESFNYLESKYIGIQTIFDLMRITFENAYIFRMITDNKDLTDTMEFRWSELGLTCSIFDLFIYLASLYCRLFGYEGIISDKLPMVMDTLGYDFNKAAEIMRSRVIADPYLTSNAELMRLLNAIRITTMEGLNTTYDNIMALRTVIADGYTNAKSKDEFFAYRDLYNALLVSKEIDAVYTDPDTGELFETFTDVLAYYSPDLMQRYLLLSDSEVTDEMTITINQLEKLITSLRYLPFSAGVSSSSMIESLFKILTFFKSAKAELIGYNITYVMSLRGTNFFKMMDLVKKMQFDYKYSEYEAFIDILQTMHETVVLRDELNVMVDQTSDLHLKSYIKDYILTLTDQLHDFTQIIDYTFKDESWYIDFLQKAQSKVKDMAIDTLMIMSDSKDVDNISFILHESRYTGTIKDEFRYFTDTFKDLSKATLYITEIMHQLDKIHLAAEAIHTRNDRFRSNIIWDDSLKSIVYEKVKDSQLCVDLIKLIDTIQRMESIQHLSDKVKTSSSSTRADSSLANVDILYNAYQIYQKSNDKLTMKEVFDILSQNTNLPDDTQEYQDNITNPTNRIRRLSTEDTVMMDLHTSNHTVSKASDIRVLKDGLYEYIDGIMTPVT